MRRYKQHKKFKENLWRCGKIIIFLLLIGGTGWLSIEAGRFLKTNSLFQIESISFENSDLMDHPRVKEVLNSNYNLNIFGFNIQGLKNTLEQIPQVKTVTVRRRFPNIVQIEITKRQPVILLNNKGSLYAVDDGGYVFPRMEGEKIWDLPVITGIDDQNSEDSLSDRKEIKLALKVNEYIKRGNDGNLPLELSEIHFGDFDGFYLYVFNPRLEIRLLEDDFQKELENLALVLANLGDKIESVDSVDLRFKGKAFIHLKG